MERQNFGFRWRNGPLGSFRRWRGTNTPERSRHSTQGVVLVWVALLLVVIIAFVGLAIDGSYLFFMRSKLQATADAAAAAGVTQVPTEERMRQIAKEYAEKNMPPGVHGTVLVDSDIIPGNWDRFTQIFSPGLDPINAVRVTTRRTQSNGNPVELFFASIVGFDESDVVGFATAMVTGGSDCFQQGIIAGNNLTVDKDIVISEQYCMYGRNGVTFHKDAEITEESGIGSLEIDNIVFQKGAIVTPSGDPPSEDNVLSSLDLQPTLSMGVETIIDYLESGLYRPPQITSVLVLDTLPDVLVDGTVYIINGNVNIDNQYEVSNVIIAARGHINWGIGGSIVNTGDPDIDFGIGILATGNVVLGKDAVLEGADIIAGNDVHIGKDVLSFEANVQAGHNAYLGKEAAASGYEGALVGFGSGGEWGTGGAILTW